MGFVIFIKMSKFKTLLKNLGPTLLFASMAIGNSYWFYQQMQERNLVSL